MTALTTRDQIEIALHGSKEFHAKSATSSNSLQPDPANDGHREFAVRLNGLADFFRKAAGYVDQGYPVQTVLTRMADDAKIDQETQTKMASLMDDIGEGILRDKVMQTYETLLREKKAALHPSPNQSTLNRITGAVQRMSALRALTGR